MLSQVHAFSRGTQSSDLASTTLRRLLSKTSSPCSSRCKNLGCQSFLAQWGRLSLKDTCKCYCIGIQYVLPHDSTNLFVFDSGPGCIKETCHGASFPHLELRMTAPPPQNLSLGHKNELGSCDNYNLAGLQINIHYMI